jgi:hypothetical protein
MAYQVYGRQNRSPFHRSWSDFFGREPDDSPPEPKSTGYTVFGKLKRPRAVQPGSLALSVSLHALLFLMLIGVVHRQQQQAKNRPKETQAPVLFYVPPPPPRPPSPPPEVFVPPPPLPPGAETDRPQAVAPSDQSPKTEDAAKPPSSDQPKAPEPEKKELASAQPAPGATEVKPPSNAEESAPKRDLVSEARRLFGQKLSTGDSSGAGEAWSPTFGKKRNCPTEEEIRDSGSTLTTMTGRVYGERRGTPLANVHLQILGTPYEAFTDGQGVYVLRFAASLVANCRIQTVRVSLAGYPMPDLSLGLFPGTKDIAIPGR